MQNDIINIKKNHIQAAEFVLEKVMGKFNGSKFIIAIAGEVASGKTTLSYLLGRMLKMKGIRSKIIDLGDFYKIPPVERAIWREKNGIESIGIEEYDWGTINNTIDSFLDDSGASVPSVDLLNDHVDEILCSFKDIEVLIINGLYAFHCKQVDFKVFIELTYRETYEAQKYTGKEELNNFRKKILKKEHEVVQQQKKIADTFIDFNVFLDSYHL